ncbi:fumarylacetoacetase [soil metagenome]
MVGLRSWVKIPDDSDFTLNNIPFGIFKRPRGSARVGSALGDFVIDLSLMAEEGFFDDLDLPDLSVFYEEVLNPFIGLGKKATNSVRQKIMEIFQEGNNLLRNQVDLVDQVLIPDKDVKMLLPVKVGDYTDFYSSEEHAKNVGSMFRDPDHALLPNWKHLPVAYHGRSSSIIVSGEPVIRPKGQFKTPDVELPVFGPTKKLDFELELAFITGKATRLGESISTQHAEGHIFGFVLFNDWSARDIQAWEYFPLGPFLGKNFASSISPWVVTSEALLPFKVPGPTQEPEVLPYLQVKGDKNFNINLTAAIQPENGPEKIISQTNFKNMYWNVNQQLAHHTINGCNINIGDIYASGTISGPKPGSYGSLLELSWNGTKPITLADNSSRTYLNDGDTVILRGYAGSKEYRVGFGEVRAKILSAK